MNTKKNPHQSFVEDSFLFERKNGCDVRSLKNQRLGLAGSCYLFVERLRVEQLGLLLRCVGATDYFILLSLRFQADL